MSSFTTLNLVYILTLRVIRLCVLTDFSAQDYCAEPTLADPYTMQSREESRANHKCQCWERETKKKGQTHKPE